jgi:LmbE family N-acetylglucosaminyl deacetylase
MMSHICIAAASAFLLVLPSSLQAQNPVDLAQVFQDLSNDCVLMDLSAHPDDEDGTTLAYYRMKFGVKTYSVLFTRGEGGQNEKGPELYEELGVLRSAETHAAGKILGAEVQFLNFLDFGYSKTATEAFQKWGGQEEVLRRLVYMIRLIKPDVIFSNHNTIDGHGHHQAVAITAIAAFDAAADSSMFPDQLRLPGVALWQPRKLFFRVWGRSEPTADVSNMVDEFDSLRGKGYIDIASEALKKHRTQGLDRANLRSFTRGKSLYKLVRANSIYDQDSTSFFSGIRLWDDLSLISLKPLRTQISMMRPGMDKEELIGRTSEVLARKDSLRSVARLSPLAQRVLSRWEEELCRLAELSCGLELSLHLKDSVIVPRQRVECSLSLTSKDCSISGVKYGFDLPGGWSMQEIPEAAPEIARQSFERLFTLTVGDDPHLTLPKASAQYGSLEIEQRVAADVRFLLDGHPFSFAVNASFDVAPFQSLTITPLIAGLTTAYQRSGLQFWYTIKNYLPHKTAGRLSVKAPAGWKGETIPFVINGEDSVVHGTVRVLPPDPVKDGEYVLTFSTDYASQTATVNAFGVRVSPGIRVGIVESYDNTLEEALDDLGVKYVLLKEDELKGGDLARFTTILIDIRAYLVREDLRSWNARLLDYARAGGNLVVMYQRDQEWKPEYAPYPFQITRKRISVEEAPIQLLVPDHPLLNSPNRIAATDWEGWKQERALYFPGDIAPQYVSLLSSHDPDEAPLTTGYLVAAVGTGSYIYTSYVWYRQLKDHNPGAFRCFANMISYPAYRK